VTLPSTLLYAVDASPMIGLAKVGRLDLLSAGGWQALVTETVYREVLAGNPKDPARLALIGGWGQKTPDVPIPNALAALTIEKSLDAGEEATLALALRTGAVAVIDDGDGRRAARALSIPHVGTAGLVVEGKRLGLVASARDTLRDLSTASIFLPRENILRALLATVGETWP
jgi:predicted nucleic acid-binding protein